MAIFSVVLLSASVARRRHEQTIEFPAIPPQSTLVLHAQRLIWLRLQHLPVHAISSPNVQLRRQPRMAR
jgi:hypothetical protein